MFGSIFSFKTADNLKTLLYFLLDAIGKILAELSSLLQLFVLVISDTFLSMFKIIALLCLKKNCFLARLFHNAFLSVVKELNFGKEDFV